MCSASDIYELYAAVLSKSNGTEFANVLKRDSEWYEFTIAGGPKPLSPVLSRVGEWPSHSVDSLWYAKVEPSRLSAARERFNELKRQNVADVKAEIERIAAAKAAEEARIAKAKADAEARAKRGKLTEPERRAEDASEELIQVPTETRYGSWGDGSGGAGGFQNQGNTCYLNSALQCILSCNRFLRVLRRTVLEKPTPLASTLDGLATDASGVEVCIITSHHTTAALL